MGFWDDIGKNVTDFANTITGNFQQTAAHFLNGGGGSARNYSNVSEGDAGRRRQQAQYGYAPPRPAADPFADAMKFADQFGVWSGGSAGSGGSPGNGAAIQALVDQINQNKADAKDRFGDNKDRLGQIYGQLKTSLEPNAGLTKARYATAIANSKHAGEGIADRAAAVQDKHDGQKADGLADLGVDASGAPSEEGQATADGLARLAQSNATWGNLQGVLSNSQQARDKLDVQGAQDAGILAEKELTSNYEDYLKQLDQQIAQAWSGYQAPSGGSGGSAPTYSNPMMDMLTEGMMSQKMYQLGLGPNPAGASAGGYSLNPQDIAALSGSIGTGLNQLGKPLSLPEILAAGGPGAAQAYQYIKG